MDKTYPPGESTLSLLVVAPSAGTDDVRFSLRR